MTTQRIGTPQTLPVEQLRPFHENPRRGNVPAIAESLVTNGQFRPIVVNRGTHTGREWEVLAGNHTLMAAQSLDGTEHALDGLDCYVLDVPDEEASRIVLADNRTADFGSYDDEALLDLLRSLDDDFRGTGYDEHDLEALEALVEPQDSLDDLADEFGDGPTDDDDVTTVCLNMVPPLYEQWKAYSAAYDSPEEAVEALMDRLNYAE